MQFSPIESIGELHASEEAANYRIELIILADYIGEIISMAIKFGD
jgi:hypothetical protein